MAAEQVFRVSPDMSYSWMRQQHTGNVVKSMSTFTNECSGLWNEYCFILWVKLEKML